MFRPSGSARDRRGMTTPPACGSNDSPPSSLASLASSRPCAASWRRSEVVGVVQALRTAQALASRLERTESERPSHPQSLRVQVVTDEALVEWLRFYRLVVGLFEAERLGDEADPEPSDDAPSGPGT